MGVAHEIRRASPPPSLAIALGRADPAPPLGNTVELHGEASLEDVRRESWPSRLQHLGE